MALESFNGVIKENQNYPLGWSNKAVVYINFGKLDKAEEVIDLAYTFFPKQPYILNKKGVILHAKNNPKEALKYFDKALGLYYQEEFLISRAKTYLSLRQWNKAISDVDKILRNNKKNFDAWMIKAEGSHHLHQPTKAKIYVKKAKEFMKQPRSLLE